MKRSTLLMLLMAGVALVALGGFAVALWKRSANAIRWLPTLNAAEDAYDIPHDLLARVAYQESHFRDDIISGALKSPAGAEGIMQLMPQFYPGINRLDPPQAILAAAKSIASYFAQFGSWKLALAAYNWGPGNVAKFANTPGKWPQETLDYVAQITKDVPVS